MFRVKSVKIYTDGVGRVGEIIWYDVRKLCRPEHRYNWSRGCMFLVHMWHVAVVADGIFACKDMKLEKKYLVVHPHGAVGQVINRPILFSSLNLQVAHLWQNRLWGK